MRLHSMTLQAVGPFAGTYTVDFAALATSGIFLLEGPTGAGKSTIIDAVVFALYGKVASASASEDRLRSGYAPDTTDTFVDLVFETGSGVFRVLRTPARQRPKRSGTGMTKQQATVRLWRLPAAALDAPLGDPGAVGELVSNRLDETGLEIQRAVGLDRTQFVQTIVLPQGEFATFLKADPENRKGLLQKVFGTEIYERAQAELAALRRAANETVSAAEVALATKVDVFAATAELGADALDAFRDAPVETLTALMAERVAELTAAAQELGAARTQAQKLLATARVALDEARATSDALARREALRSEQTLLADRADEVAGQETTLAAAARAALVKPMIVAEHRAEVAMGEAAERLWDAIPAVAPWCAAAADLFRAESPELPFDGLNGVIEDAPEVRATLQARRESDSAQVVRLARLAEIEAGLPGRRAGHDAAAQAAQELQDELDAVALELARRPAERVEVEAVRDTLRATAARLPTLREAAKRAADMVAACATLAVFETAVEQSGAALGKAQTAAHAAAETEAALRRSWIAGLAGEVASGLVDAEPCPVCGSCTHPNPASLGADHIDKETVEAAEKARRGAIDRLSVADRDAAAAEERLRSQREIVDGTTAETAAADLVAADLAVAEAVVAEQASEKAAAHLAAFDADTAKLAASQAKLAATLVRALAELEHAGSAIDADAAEVARVLEAVEADTISAVVASLTEQIKAIDTLLAAHDDALARASDHAGRQAELAGALAENGFGSPDEAQSAQLSEEVIADWSEAVAQHRSDLARVRHGLADPPVASLPEGVELDLKGLGQGLTEAEENAERLGARSALVVDQVAKVRAAADAATAAATALATARTAAAPVVRMANVAAGTSADNAKALTLGTFVLVRRFEDVVAAANTRLATMSDGRFELVSSDEREDVRTKRTGLAMKVFDHQTETARDPRTLSGGETFYVSLCLALGMADVVTAEAGGIDLGTLFVDEGFGSLDPETLDAVLGVLGGLRAGGRVVGVVSHVEELKRRVSDGISVRRMPDGSSSLTVRAS